jgi:hypothetical protein
MYECRCEERLKTKSEESNLHVSHTLGCSGIVKKLFVVYYESIKRKLKTKYIYILLVVRFINFLLLNKNCDRAVTPNRFGLFGVTALSQFLFPPHI